MGGAFGLFLSGLDSPVTREKMTARETLREMGQKSKSYAKNFAMIGLMFAGTECLLESVSVSLESVAGEIRNAINFHSIAERVGCPLLSWLGVQ